MGVVYLIKNMSSTTAGSSSSSGGNTFGQKLTRDDWKKQKELEEARKAGTAPAEVDEEGR